MSYSIFLLRIVDGEVVALDAERLRQVTEPYVVVGGLEEVAATQRAPSSESWTQAAVILNGGKCNDVTQLMPLIDAIPPIRGGVGRPLGKLDSLFADRRYDHDIYRDQV